MVLVLLAHHRRTYGNIFVHRIPTHRRNHHIFLQASKPFRVRNLLACEHFHELVAVAAKRAVDDFPHPVFHHPILHLHFRVLSRLGNELALDHLIAHFDVTRRVRKPLSAHFVVDVGTENRLRPDLRGNTVHLQGEKLRPGDCDEKNSKQGSHFSIAAMAAPTMGASSTCAVIS